MAGMTGMEEGGWAAKLFSSALFCLWLSLASVTVWFDTGSSRAPMTAQSTNPEEVESPASVSAEGATTDVAGAATAPASRRDTRQPLSRATPATGAEPDAA